MVKKIILIRSRPKTAALKAADEVWPLSINHSRPRPLGRGNRRLILLIGLVSMTLAGPNIAEGEIKMRLSSPAFENNQFIPQEFTCNGKNVNPPFIIEGIPKGAKSLALLVDDPDAPMGTWVHWVVYDIPLLSRIEEDSVPGKQGVNDFGRKDYGGPCPPSGTHRYFFKIYALDKMLGLSEGASKKALEGTMQGHILDKAELVGLYKRALKNY